MKGESCLGIVEHGESLTPFGSSIKEEKSGHENTGQNVFDRTFTHKIADGD